MLDREAILGKTDLPREQVEVEEWGGAVFVKAMTAGERDQWEAAHLKDPYVNLRARTAALTVCDDQGRRLFSDGDIPALAATDAKALDRVFEVAVRIGKITKPEVDQLEKNSAPIPSGSSASG